jgi:hypothetical protein
MILCQEVLQLLNSNPKCSWATASFCVSFFHKANWKGYKQIPFCLANVSRQEAPHVLAVCSSGMNLSHPNKRPEQIPYVLLQFAHEKKEI